MTGVCKHCGAEAAEACVAQASLLAVQIFFINKRHVRVLGQLLLDACLSSLDRTQR